MKKLKLFNGHILIKELNLDDYEYSNFINTRNTLETYYHVEQLLFILNGNYNEYCLAINSITLKNFFEDSIEKEIAIDITNVNWKLLNLSASFRCYIDHVKGSQDNKGLFEELKPILHRKIAEKYNKIKESEPDARYLYTFRNEIQHNNLPIQIIGLERNVIGNDNKTRVVNMTYNEELANKDYVRIGNGLQSLFDIHYDIIKNDFKNDYDNAKREYINFINKYSEDKEHFYIHLEDDEDENTNGLFITKNFIKRIDLLIDKNPSRKPNVKGWFPGIINIADIHENKKKNK